MGNSPDANAPQLATLFSPYRTPYESAVLAQFHSVRQVYNWNWQDLPNIGTRGLAYNQANSNSSRNVTAIGVSTVAGEQLHSPVHGYNLGGSLGAGTLVLFADADSITLKTARQDTGGWLGYTIHIDGICVDPNMLTLYNTLDNADRNSIHDPAYGNNNPQDSTIDYNLPGLTSGQIFGTATGNEMVIAISDTGEFMDPRSSDDWWKNATYNPGYVSPNVPGPSAPALSNPANAAISSDNTPDFSWGAVGNGDTYEIQIDNDSNFSSPVQDVTGASGVLTYTATTLADGLYYWRVRAYDTTPTAGTWSSSRTLTVDTTAPGAFTLSAPADNVTVNTGTVAFSWGAASGASQYYFEIDDDPGFSPALYNSGWQTGTSFTPPSLAVGIYYWRVKAHDAAAPTPNETGWVGPRTLNVHPPLPAPPSLSGPSSALATFDTTPTFTWSGSADTFDIEYGTASNFSGATLVNTGATPSFTPGAPLADGTYYWHVRGLNSFSEPGAWSAARTVIINTTSTPALSSPADNTIVRSGTVSFSWGSLSIANKYRFQIDDNTGFSSPDDSGPISLTSYSPSSLALGVYYWKVRAIDALGNEGPWSAYRTLNVNPPLPAAPALVSPATGFKTSNVQPTFSWNSVANATSYEVQVDNNNTFASPEATDTMGSLAFTPGSPLASAVYYWRVRGLNSYSEPGAWSAARTITIDASGPVAPALSLPANNAIIRTGKVTFSWGAVSGATAYQFMVDDNNDFSSPVDISGVLAVTGYTPPSLAVGVYYWRARSQDSLGNWGVWSAHRTLNVNPPLPKAPALVSPANGSPTGDNTPTFTWNSITNAATYEIQVDNNNTFASPEASGTVGSTNFTPGAPLTPDATFYWRVRGKNSLNEPGAWSAARTVIVDTTAPVLPPVLVSPGDVATVTGMPSFSWQSVATAKTYVLQYNSINDFTGSVLYASGALGGTSFKPPTGDTGTIYWRMQAVDAAGNSGPWSAVRTLTINPAVPTAPTLVSPASGLLTPDNTPTFTWKSVVNAASYEIEISTSSVFSGATPLDAGSSLAYTPGAPLTLDGIYYWRVRGKNSSLTPGAWSATRYVRIDTTAPVLAPVLVSPNDPATVTGMPTFSWGSVATAKNYILQYNTINDFSGSVLYASAPMGVLSFKPPAGSVGTIYWRVGSVDAVGNAGPWSASRTLTINPPVPTVPGLVSPANGAKTADNTPTFTWNTVTYATSYDIQIDNNSTFVSPEASNTGALTNFTPGALADGTYYWRVRASSSAGNSGWSSARSVIIDTIGPNAPQQNAPANSAVVRGMPSLSWLSASTAVMYQMRYSDVSDLSTVMYTSPAVKTLSYAPPTGDMGVLYWQVRAQDSVGNWGPWGTIRMVTILPIIPAAPALSSPLTGATLTINPLTFSWTTVIGGVTYQIQIDNNNTFNGPEYDDTAATTSRTPALANGAYYWRVRALNINSEPGPWSTVRTVVIAL